MELTIPSPIVVEIQRPEINIDLSVDNLPSPIQVLYDTDTYSISIGSEINLNNELLKFYTILFLSSIDNTLDKILASVTDVIKYVASFYKYEKELIKAKYTKTNRQLFSRYGSVASGVIASDFLNTLSYNNIDENASYLELSLKTIDKLFSMLNELYSNVIAKYSARSNLYTKIPEEDFKLTSKAITDWIEYLNIAYNARLEEYALKIDQLMVNMAVFEANIESVMANLEKTRAQIVNVALSNEATNAINEFVFQKQQYATELKRFGLLNFEAVELLIREYEAKLRKFGTEIQTINSVAKLIRTAGEVYKAKVGVSDAKLDVFLEELNTAAVKLNTTDDQISAELNKAEALFKKYNSQIQYERTKTLRERVSALGISLDAENSLKLLLQDIMEERSRLVEFRKDIVESYEELIRHETNMSIMEMETRQKLDFMLSDYSWKISMAERAVNMIANSIADWFRTCAVTSANITASFIRSYS